MRKTHWPLLALKVKEGAMGKGMWASEKCKAGGSKVTDSPLKPPEGTSPAPADLSPVTLIPDF